MSKRRIAAFVLLCILSLSWMGVMFGFSANNADESSMQSHGVVELFLKVFVPGYDDMSQQEQESLINKYDKPVRKTAHFAAYAILALLIYFAAGSVKLLPSRLAMPAAVALVVCVLFAFSDEYHQTFVDGRAGRLSDVVIDSCGALFGIALAAAAVIIYIKHKTKSKNAKTGNNDTYNQ